MVRTVTAVARNSTTLVRKALQNVLASSQLNSLLYRDKAFSPPLDVRYHFGIDIGSRVTGITLLRQTSNFNVETIHSDVVLTKNYPCIISKADAILQQLQTLKNDCPEKETCVDWNVAIEDCLLGFQSARFSTKGLVILAQLNGIVKYSCVKMFNVQPVNINPRSARSMIGLKITKGKDVKEQVTQYVRTLALHMNLDHMYSSSFGKDPTDGDRADSFIVAFNSILASRKNVLMSENIKGTVKSCCFENFRQSILDSGYNMKTILEGKQMELDSQNGKQKRYKRPSEAELTQYFDSTYDKLVQGWHKKDAKAYVVQIKSLKQAEK
mmetsp:Transcript_19235/g.25074  ORF Transcript_19235/g.25074 Transcript_19235/m.25074 type:complete len:325 (-) Transcript_19235:516-1490(-)